jgi:CheY-like chemotaxis protein/HPt (histidine-containing phosphotransfer) domain-containing protein
MLDFGTKRNQPAVLLIDDDMVSREVLATVLTLGGYAVHTAEDGAAALALLAAEGCAPGVILVDAQMPGLSGPKLIAALRKRSRAVVVAMSGSNAPRELTATADGFLLKPFGADALDAALRELAKKTDKKPARAGRGKGRRRKTAHDEDSLSGEPVVKAEILTQFRQMMPEAGVREIYEAIVTDLRKRLAALDEAIAAGDADGVRRIGHSIKGGCGMAGAMQASRLGALLEAAGAEGNQLDNSAGLVGELRGALANLESMLNSEFPG